MSAPSQQNIKRRVVGNNVWLSKADASAPAGPPAEPARSFPYEVLASEEAVGQAMLTDLEEYARAQEGDLVIVLLGGRGAQAMYRLLSEQARTGAADWLLT